MMGIGRQEAGYDQGKGHFLYAHILPFCNQVLSVQIFLAIFAFQNITFSR